MTFIQPTKHKNIYNLILVALAIAVFTGTLFLVITYNKTVNLSHDISSAKAELDAIGAQNTAANNAIIATLGGDNLAALASASNLVQENSPQYFQLDKKWPIASH
jgi:hypothetical protein